MIKVGVNASRRLLWNYPLSKRFKILDMFLEIFERFKRREEWYVELGISAFPEVFGASGRGIKKQVALKIRRVADKRGFKLTIHAPHINEKLMPDLNLCSLSKEERKTSLNYALSTIDLAYLLEAEFVTFHPGYIYKGFSPGKERFLSNYLHEAKKYLIESLKKLASHAEKNGLTITIENMEPRIDVGYLLTHPSETKEVVKAVGNKFLKITYDVAHAALAASYYKFDQVKNFMEIADQVVKLHIHDNLCKPGLYGRVDYAEGIGDLHLVPLIGKGKVPNEAILKVAGRKKLVIYEVTPLEVEFRLSLKKLREIFGIPDSL